MYIVHILVCHILDRLRETTRKLLDSLGCTNVIGIDLDVSYTIPCIQQAVFTGVEIYDPPHGGN